MDQVDVAVVADGDQPERSRLPATVRPSLAGEPVDHREPRLAAAGDRHRLVAADPLPRLPHAFRVHLDQPEQQLQRLAPLRPQAIEQIVRRPAEQAGKAALFGEKPAT